MYYQVNTYPSGYDDVSCVCRLLLLLYLPSVQYFVIVLLSSQQVYRTYPAGSLVVRSSRISSVRPAGFPQHLLLASLRLYRYGREIHRWARRLRSPDPTFSSALLLTRSYLLQLISLTEFG
jgi:hypothetical protein